MKADLVISNIGQLVTCASADKPKRAAAMRDVGLIENGAIAVVGGSVAAVGTTSIITNEWSGNEIDAKGKVVCPGFVDPHTHIVYAGDRLDEFESKIKGADYLAILAAGGGILSTVSKTRAASIDELSASGLLRLDNMLACGTTTAEIKTGYGLDTGSELKMLQVIERLDTVHAIDIVPTFLAAHAVPTEYNRNSDGYVSLICEEMLPAAWDWYENSRFTGRVPFFIDVFCEKNAFDLGQTIRIFETAKRFGFQIKAHVDEFANLGGSRACISMGATSIDHLDAISPDEIKQLAASDTIGVITPTVNFNLGSARFADPRRLIDSGCAIALSTDYNPGSAPCPSQPMTMAIATRYQKLLPSESLNTVTVNAAYAIAMGNSHGSIEIGKIADIVLLDVSDFREIAYQFGTTPVRSVYKKGKLVFDRCGV